MLVQALINWDLCCEKIKKELRQIPCMHVCQYLQVIELCWHKPTPIPILWTEFIFAGREDLNVPFSLMHQNVNIVVSHFKMAWNLSVTSGAWTFSTLGDIKRNRNDLEPKTFWNLSLKCRLTLVAEFLWRIVSLRPTNMHMTICLTRTPNPYWRLRNCVLSHQQNLGMWIQSYFRWSLGEGTLGEKCSR